MQGGLLMRNSRKLVVLLWSVIAVLVIGGGIAGYLLAHKVDQLTLDNSDLVDSNASLRRQLHELQASASPSPSPSPSPSATSTPSTTVTPKASAAPSATPTPTPVVTPKSKSNL
jgi:cytoskeletal protein RodZ